jgi:hypothetical protein
MASTDGDSRNVIHTALAQLWNDGDVRLEAHTADVSLDGSGAGTATVSHNESFGTDEVYALATGTGSGEVVAVTAAGASQSTVDVTSGASDGTATVNVLVVGPDASA